MTMMTPGLAGSLTPRDWTARQLERRERGGRDPQPRVARRRLLPRVGTGPAVP
ncbi:hypothetical protein [Phycicoccus avicenniae]|uniref:hypothetical protein n=1 Tax=Phycicoccus avicenniae TaxID=2828860 RepID=UPI003D2CD8F6